jgi:hypothetical protein
MHRDHGIEETWPVAERLLLAVSFGPGSQRGVASIGTMDPFVRTEAEVGYA